MNLVLLNLFHLLKNFQWLTYKLLEHISVCFIIILFFRFPFVLVMYLLHTLMGSSVLVQCMRTTHIGGRQLLFVCPPPVLLLVFTLSLFLLIWLLKKNFDSCMLLFCFVLFYLSKFICCINYPK